MQAQRYLPSNVMAQSSKLCSSPASALFEQQLHTCNHEWQPDRSDTCFSEFQDLRNPGLVSCHDGWRVCHKQECFYFLSRPLPTSYTSRFTDASRWWKEIRKYVGLIRFCLVTRILPRMLFCFWKGVGLRIPLYLGSSFIAHIVRCEAKRLRCLRLLLSSSKSLIKHFERPNEPLSKAHQSAGETKKTWWEERSRVELQEMISGMRDEKGSDK